MLIASILLAVAPAILLVIYFYKRDKNKPEPKKTIIKAFFAGIFSVVPAIIMAISLASFENVSNPVIQVFIKSFITAGFVEEFSKLFVFWIFIMKSRDFDEITDGIVYMAIISLGFAAFENILYSTGDLFVGLLRAFTAVPGHALWSAVMGFYIGYAKLKKDTSPFYIMVGLFFGVFYHGLYDFVLFAANHVELAADYGWMAFLIFPILIICFIHSHRLLKRSLKMDIESGFSYPLIDKKYIINLKTKA